MTTRHNLYYPITTPSLPTTTGDPRLFPIIMGAHDMVSNGGWPSPTRPDAYVDCLVCADCGLRLESVHRYADGAALFALYTWEPGALWNSPPERCDALAPPSVAETTPARDHADRAERASDLAQEVWEESDAREELYAGMPPAYAPLDTVVIFSRFHPFPLIRFCHEPDDPPERCARHVPMSAYARAEIAVRIHGRHHTYHRRP